MSEKSTSLPTIQPLLPIPDMWFDVIARLLPGLLFVFAVRVLLMADTTTPDSTGLVVLTAFSYLVGFFICPISSRSSMPLEKWAELRNGEKSKFVLGLLHSLGRESRDAMILSKMHGEVVFFVQCAWLSILFYVALAYSPTQSPYLTWWMPLVFLAISVCLAFEVADRRVKRAKDIPTKPVGSGSQ